MKHIKLFEYFEDNNFVNTLQDFCNDNLAFLIDDDYRVNTDEEFGMKNRKEVISITISRHDFFKYKEHIKGKRFNYNDIKDDFIPFLELLTDKYSEYEYDLKFLTIDVDEVKLTGISDTIQTSALLPYKESIYDVNYIINDNIPINLELGLLTAIEIMVMG